MSQLSQKDLVQVQELSESLGPWREGGPPALTWLVPRLGKLLEAEKMLAYGVTIEDDSFSLAFANAVGARTDEQSLRMLWDRLLRSMKGSLAMFNPACPAIQQRNKAVAILPLSKMVTLSDPQVVKIYTKCGFPRDSIKHVITRVENSLYLDTFVKVGIERDHQLRTLVCDKSTLLASVGAGREDPFTERERLIMNYLTPAIRSRLRLEQRIALADLRAATLDMLLENSPTAVFVLNANGRIQHENPIGKMVRQREGSSLHGTLQAAMKGTCSDVVVRELKVPGCPKHYLAIFAPFLEPRARVELAKHRWRLTSREAEVLVLLASGASNKEIAASMTLAERTIEEHVTRLLRKSGATGRASLIAKIYTG